MALDWSCRCHLFGAAGLENRGRWDPDTLPCSAPSPLAVLGLSKTGFSRVKQYCGVLYRRYVYGCGVDTVRRHYGMGALQLLQ